MFFDNWQGLVRVLVVGTLAYLALVLLLRITGKRSVAKWNAFDLIVTVALGSTLATVLLTKDIALLEGLAGFFLLAALQFVLTWCSVRAGWVRRLVKSSPTLLLARGRPLEGAMRAQRVTLSELRAAVREQGIARLEDVGAVVLESDGKLSVIRDIGNGASALDGVDGAREHGLLDPSSPAPDVR